MIKAAMFWNEPNNKSHWDPALDPDWSKFGEMVNLAADAVKSINPNVLRMVGGMSPIDPAFLDRLRSHGTLERMDVVAVHGFPLDWNLWPINDWPQKIDEMRAETDLPIWVTEVGVSTFGAEEVQDWGLGRTAELLRGKADRVFWYSLYDLPRSWEATTRHREAEGSSYYRHFYMGLLREDGSPKPSLERFRQMGGELGLMQWFHYEDHRLEEAVQWFRRLGVKHVRTGLSWADSFRPNAIDWFDRQMDALAEFDVTATFCFTPDHLGIEAHHTSPPRDPQGYADFCAWMVDRYGNNNRTLITKAAEAVA
jgi:beta-xylosidase